MRLRELRYLGILVFDSGFQRTNYTKFRTKLLALVCLAWMMAPATARATLVASPTSADFGYQKVGVNSTDFKITMSNTSGSSISITVGSPTSPFHIDTSPSDHCAGSIPANSSCSLYVYIDPPNAGNVTGSVSVNTVSISLTASALALNGNVYYISPQGNDSWSGKLPVPNQSNTDGPFLSLHEARTTISGNAGGNLIEIESGTYYVGTKASSPLLYTATVGGYAGTGSIAIPTVCSASGSSLPVCPEVFTASDSGGPTNGPVIYEAAPGANPVLSGGIRIPASAWHLYANGVYYADLNMTSLELTPT